MGSTQSLGFHADCCPTNKERCGIDSILFHGYFESSMQFLQALGFNPKDEVLQEICTLLEANGTWDCKEGCQQLWMRTRGEPNFHAAANRPSAFKGGNHAPQPHASVIPRMVWVLCGSQGTTWSPWKTRPNTRRHCAHSILRPMHHEGVWRKWCRGPSVLIIVVDYNIRHVHKLMQLDVVPEKKKAKSN